MKKILILMLIVLEVFALDIDIKSLEKKVAQNPDDLNNRNVIASYYIEHENYKKAEKYINEVLKKDPKNKYAQKLQKKISAFKKYNALIKKYGSLNNAFDVLYKKQKYKELLKDYRQLKIISKTSLLNENNKINIARVAMWKGKYNLSLNILSGLKNKQSLDYYDITAYDLYYKGDYQRAKKYFQILYQTTGKPDYAKKLLNIYFYLGDINSAQKLLFSLKRSNPKLAAQYENKIKKLKNAKLKKLQEKYKQNPSFENLEPLVYLMFKSNPNEAIALVKNYIKKRPNDKNAKIFLAKLLSWNGDNEAALKYLSEFQNSNDMQAKLLFGKILAWQGDYDKATLFLTDVYEHGNKQEKYQAKKLLGFIALWKDDKKQAKKIFKSLLKQNPQDSDVKEALMVLNNDIKPLIKKYEKLLKKHPGNEEYILKLADYNYMIKNYEKAAYYYEKYLKIHPEKIDIYKTLGDIYLQLKNYYKGFGYFEYYANYKNTKEAYLELAKRYYWNGFNKEALNVLNELLKKYPNDPKALLLKAKILKVNPRFVNTTHTKTIEEYFNKRSDKILALGDRAYFAGLYSSAAEYYKEYLFLKPNDYDVREKYAYSLEKNKNYKKAAGEFYLLMWYKKTPLIEYHYAYNLQKSGKIKQAEKIYKNILKNSPKPLPPFLKRFINDWKNAWESMNFKKYASFYDNSISKKLYWRLKKQSIFSKSSYISVGIYNPLLISENNNTYKVKFFQVYASKIEKDKGYKTLTIKCKNKTDCKIIKETWSPGVYEPYNPNNSLDYYIKQDLNELNSTKPEIKLIPSGKEQNETNLTKNIQPSVSKNKTLKKYREQKNTYTKNKLYGIELWGNIDLFSDNQKTDMITRRIKLSYHGKKITPFIFYTNYNLTDAKSNTKGFLYGMGFKKNSFLFDAFIDRSGVNTLGWDIEYSPSDLNGIILRLNKHNMVYTRRSVCSSGHTRIKAEITQTKPLNKKRELWWSVAYEKVDDTNNILTPQFEYDIKSYSYKKNLILFYLSGWYQLNSKPTDCYYSPDKTDTTILGFKIYKNINRFQIKGKIGLGYSFLDNTLVYKLGLWAYTLKTDTFYAKIGCDYSNGSTVNKSTNYKSLECALTARKLW